MMESAVRWAAIHRLGRRLVSRGLAGVARLTIILILAMGAAGCAQHRVADGPPLQIHRQFGGYKFTYDSPAEQPVWDWFSLDPGFASTLERHPTALEEARKAAAPHTAGRILGVAYLAWGVKVAFFSWETDNLGLNQHTASGADWAILGGLLVGGVVSDRMARGRLDRAVSLFNAEEMGSARQNTAHRDLFRRLSLSPTYRPGNGVGLLARLSLR